MNNKQRKRIDEIKGTITTGLESLRAAAFELKDCREKLSSSTEELKEIGDEEQEKFDNLSEGLQSSEKGQQMEAWASTISDAVTLIESSLQEIEDLDLDEKIEEIESALSDLEGVE